MGISGISNPSSYEEWQLLQDQKEKAQAASAKSGAAEAAQIEAIGNEVNGLIQETRSVSSDRMDTIEISSEGRAFQENQAVSENIPAPFAKPVSEVKETENGNSNNDLTTLTEEEIQKLVDNGTITQAEANAELARREESRPEEAEMEKKSQELVE
ncbi:hypothetical protein SAMN05443270_0622 [Lacrimispora sphenoides]|jgi:hypothetical protein|uniref:hypothetical protein n=1 Tax=Lacrimispora sphenoides TaxID=29370 RepID=UPI0008D3E091|nr:hypothetical protein [Lacrimispora sphenoides]SET59667.1 hypothetical protein SAMN05443270_0622 [Lacrimispora sphenoides]